MGAIAHQCLPGYTPMDCRFLLWHYSLLYKSLHMQWINDTVDNTHLIKNYSNAAGLPDWAKKHQLGYWATGDKSNSKFPNCDCVTSIPSELLDCQTPYCLFWATNWNWTTFGFSFRQCLAQWLQKNLATQIRRYLMLETVEICWKTTICFIEKNPKL